MPEVACSCVSVKELYKEGEDADGTVSKWDMRITEERFHIGSLPQRKANPSSGRLGASRNVSLRAHQAVHTAGGCK